MPESRKIEYNILDLKSQFNELAPYDDTTIIPMMNHLLEKIWPAYMKVHDNCDPPVTDFRTNSRSYNDIIGATIVVDGKIIEAYFGRRDMADPWDQDTECYLATSVSFSGEESPSIKARDQLKNVVAQQELEELCILTSARLKELRSFVHHTSEMCDFYFKKDSETKV